MTQLQIPIKRTEIGGKPSPVDPLHADAVELSYRDDVMVIRFVRDPRWGRTTRTVLIDRSVADDLTRLLNQELSTLDWSE